MHHAPEQSSSSRWIKALLLGTIASTLIYFFAWDGWRGYRPWPDVQYSTLGWLYSSWNAETYYWDYSWLTVLVMAACMVHSVRRMKHEPVSAGRWGLLTMTLGLLLHAQAIRSQMVPFSVAGLVLLILGGVHFTSGWRRARLLLFPLSLTALLVPFPLQPLVNHFWKPADNLARELFTLVGGQQYFGSTGMFRGPMVNFKHLLPVLLLGLVMARFCHRALAGRLFIALLALPVAFSTESLRAALRSRLIEMRHPIVRGEWWVEIELLFTLLLSAACFLLACRLTGGIGSASWRTARQRTADLTG